MILSNTLYNKNKNQIFTITHTILKNILDVASVSAKNDAIEFNIISMACNHADMNVCFKNISYFPSLKSSSSIVSIYPFLLLI